MPTGTPSWSPEQTIGAWLLMYGIDPAKADELAEWLRKDGFIPEWHDIASAPKDGRVIDLTWMEDGKPQEIWPMQWGHIQRNGLIPGKVGMWTATDGSLTWDDSHPNGAPTHWRPHK